MTGRSAVVLSLGIGREQLHGCLCWWVGRTVMSLQKFTSGYYQLTTPSLLTISDSETKWVCWKKGQTVGSRSRTEVSLDLGAPHQAHMGLKLTSLLCKIALSIVCPKTTS
jgi:hypothetical protein